MTKRKAADYTPDPSNANVGTERGLRALDDSLSKYGAGRSILVDKNGYVIGGNKTLERAVDLGFDEVIEVETDGRQLVAVKRTDLDLLVDPRARELAYADNRVAQLDLEWSPEQLLADLNAGVDLRALWGDDGHLDELLRSITTDDPTPDAGAQIDRAAELQETWQVQRGDLWQIGKHRLLCGDSTVAGDVERVMGGEKADAVVTDPPYAFGLASTMNMATKSGGWHDMMNNSSWFTDRYKQWSELIGAGVIWMFCNWRTLPIIMRAGFDSALGINSVMVWYKDWIGPGGQLGLRPTYELIALTVVNNKGIPSRGVEDFYKSAWSSHKPSGHQAEKPIDLLEHLVRISECEIVFEPFGGSGTTMVACEQLGRQCRMIEISEKYCAVILQRMSDMGLKPTRINL